MRRLRNISLKRKLTLISMVTSCAALLLTGAVIVGYERVSSKRALVKEVLTTSQMIGDNSAAALTFDDPESAAQTLRSLSADPHVVAAFVYDSQGHPFASFHPPGMEALPPPPVEKNLHRFSGQDLEIFRDVAVAGETIGTVYLRHDLVELRDSLKGSVYLILGAMVAALLAALVLTRKLQPLVAGPIIELAQIVRDVAAHKNFSIRAVKQGDDEVGRLIEGFNEMLSEIQHRDSALQAAQDCLEKRVAERTGELAGSLSVLNATLDSTADGILAAQLSGEIVCYNTQFVEMWGIAADVLERRNNAEFIHFLSTKVCHAEQYIARIQEQRASCELDGFDVIELRDGRTFERYVKPQRVDGKVVGVVINYRDITERKRSEANLESIHRELLETSRQAGMAEVATSVLHNVGNVLNSVNVSATLVAENVRKSKVGNLGRVVALLDQHAADLGAFVTGDAQGQNLPEFLRQLHERLSKEQQTTLTEVESLRDNIEHIKEIVSMQQAYARVTGVAEVLKVTDLVEDSLRMNAAELTRHGIVVEREYQDIPPISVEKHKVLQVLVNLIRNAKYACDEGRLPDKRVTVKVANGDGRIKISVSDNGVGIPPENLTRIFSHGFTTRKDGHGFGLHSGALAAREMGGALRVESRGSGLGATFTLELPAGPAREGRV